MDTLKLIEKLKDRIDDTLESVDDETGMPLVSHPKDISAIANSLSVIHRIESIVEEKAEQNKAASEKPTVNFPAMPLKAI